MTENTIQCPKCGTSISLNEALSADVKEQYRKEFQEITTKREAELSKLQSTLTKEKEALATQKSEIDKTVQSRLSLEKTALEKKMREEIQSSIRLEVEDLKAQVSEKAKRIEESEKIELDLRKKARALEEKEKSLEVELQRKFDAEKEKIQAETTQKLTEEIRLKAAEKDKQLDDMRRQIEDLKRKAEQGSQQSQGEILELEVESALKALFPIDQIDPVPKGMKGGDIIQKVITASGQHAGTIIWETKRTKSWSDGWIDKLKEDQRAISAELAVIVTQVLPKDVSHLALVDGIWVADFMTFGGIAVALRSNLLQLFQARAVAAGKGEKMDFLYNYLTGTQFKQRIETIVESFRTMQEDLDKEKRVIQKGWAAREQQLVRVLTSTVGMYGDIQGIVGASLPKIAALELEAPIEEKKHDE
jgi:hypothetical protein